jgi:hypothetical protein
VVEDVGSALGPFEDKFRGDVVLDELDAGPLGGDNFENVYFFYKFLKSLILLMLWICDFCHFVSYLVFWLYYGCMDFPHFS